MRGARDESVSAFRRHTNAGCLLENLRRRVVVLASVRAALVVGSMADNVCEYVFKLRCLIDAPAPTDNRVLF